MSDFLANNRKLTGPVKMEGQLWNKVNNNDDFCLLSHWIFSYHTSVRKESPFIDIK